jgi:predicted nucleotidyltransferase
MNNKQYILSIVKKKIKEIDPDAHIILFGSRARDNFHKDSDWDFLILTKMNATRNLKNKICDALFEAELETGQVLTGIVQNKNAWENYSETPIYKNISNEGELI